MHSLTRQPSESPVVPKPTRDAVRGAIRDFFARWRPSLVSTMALAPSDNLLEFLDSFAFVELLLHLEKTFNVRFHTKDIELSEIVVLDRLIARLQSCADAAPEAEQS